MQHFPQVGLADLHQHGQRFFVLVDLVVVQAHDAVHLVEFPEQLDLAFVAAHGELVLVFEGDPFQREDLEVLGHDPVHLGGTATANAVQPGEHLAIDGHEVALLLRLGGGCRAGRGGGGFEDGHLRGWRRWSPGVFWLMTARAGREADAVAGVGASIFSSWAMLNLSLRPSAAPLSLLRLKVGGGSFS